MKEEASNNNIILFPKLEQRLLQKGKDYLDRGRVNEAIPLLLDAKKINSENQDILYTLTAAYLKLGSMQKALDIVEEMLNLGIGDYFETTDMYITILFQLHEYKKIQQLITMLMEENQIPFSKMDQYTELLHLCERMDDVENIEHSREFEPIENIFEGNFTEIVQNIAQLDIEQIQHHIDTIRNFLRDEEEDPFIKTILLNTLKENDYREVVTIKKFGMEMNLNVMEYPSVREVPFVEEVKQFLFKQYEQKNPSLMEYTNTLCERFFFNIYPLERDFTNVELWANAILRVVDRYMNENEVADGNDSQFRISNGIDEDKLQEAQQFILAVEQKFVSRF
ncbi:hypothetical protein OEV98_10780 [Caldibacillus lycopersici]|uniref:Tetratricopeptide repeat protein n=1 Tax=Perspicuibacillus lycopersici TaxID=1325689 RepID=A0AAE3IVC0_9BACI|nr:hypothetical protein [Perspicuibacillus lycopersici]MCU9614046.1 hypothetical protein [Perspicuibacillus lycopersici]